MEVTLTSQAEKSLKKLPLTIRKKLIKQLNFLDIDPFHPSLHARKMEGFNHFEARIDRHYRFTFKIENEIIYILTIGPHDEGLGRK